MPRLRHNTAALCHEDLAPVCKPAYLLAVVLSKLNDFGNLVSHIFPREPKFGKCNMAIITQRLVLFMLAVLVIVPVEWEFRLCTLWAQRFWVQSRVGHVALLESSGPRWDRTEDTVKAQHFSPAPFLSFSFLLLFVCHSITPLSPPHPHPPTPFTSHASLSIPSFFLSLSLYGAPGLMFLASPIEDALVYKSMEPSSPPQFADVAHNSYLGL